MVQGARLGYQNRLQPPVEVTAAVQTYRKEEDWIARFLTDRCTVGKDLTARASELYKSFAEWCKENGEPCPSSTAFGRRLAGRFHKRNDGTGICYYGLQVGPEEEFPCK
jgi:putative DNA primase/helicase